MSVCVCVYAAGVCLCMCIYVTVKEMKCVHVSPAACPPAAVDGCRDRQQRLTGRGLAARCVPNRFLYRSLHQIGDVSQISPAAQHTLSESRGGTRHQRRLQKAGECGII